jgi:hypothetical protein
MGAAACAAAAPPNSRAAAKAVRAKVELVLIVRSWS